MQNKTHSTIPLKERTEHNAENKWIICTTNSLYPKQQMFPAFNVSLFECADGYINQHDNTMKVDTYLANERAKQDINSYFIKLLWNVHTQITGDDFRRCVLKYGNFLSRSS
jgi:hypothetical protein